MDQEFDRLVRRRTNALVELRSLQGEIQATARYVSERKSHDNTDELLRVLVVKDVSVGQMICDIKSGLSDDYQPTERELLRLLTLQTLHAEQELHRLRQWLDSAIRLAGRKESDVVVNNKWRSMVLPRQYKHQTKS